MRIVRYASQERVDLPDKTAEDFLVLGEFRRTVRGILLGDEGTGFENYVLRGFKVEPESPASARVVVKLDPGGGAPLSFAIGAENDGSRVDHGHLIGGNDLFGLLEGNAQQILDFTGQPIATYRVQMRFVYATGASDNRAFWDEGTNSESISATHTRHLPLVELRFSGAASDEWIDLADVAWDGSTIDAADITDLRKFAFEGTSPFSRTTQAGAGGMADFDRSADRATNGVNEVYRVLRGLARQIQDLKGPDDTGAWNWYGRVFGPLDPASTLDAQQTKTLRSVETVEFTVGDGATTFGDFNGATGLNTCLQHIATNAASFPNHIRILIRSHQTGGGTTFTIANQFAVTGKHIEIVGAGHGANGRVQINVTYNAGGAALSLAGVSSLRLENLAMTAPASGCTVVSVAEGRGTVIRNCEILGVTSASTAFRAAYLACEGLVIENSYISGRVAITGTTLGDATADYGGHVRNTKFVDTALHLAADTFGAANMTFEDCEFTAPATPFTNDAAALVNANESTFITLRSCQLFYHPDQNGVHALRTRLMIDRCYFTHNASAITHAAAAGVHGGDGTGWAISLNSAQSIVVRDTDLSAIDDVVDAGGIYVDETCRDVMIRNVRVERCGANATGGATFAAVRVLSGAQRVRIVDSMFMEWATAGTDAVIGVDNEAIGTLIEGCTFDGRDFAAAELTSASAQAIDNGTGGDGARIVGCEFFHWRSGTSGANSTIQNAGRNVVISGCSFEDNGGYSIYVPAAGSHTTVTGCTFYSTSNNNVGVSFDAAYGCVTGCTFNFTGGTIRDAIRMSSTAGPQIATGNIGQGTGGGVLTRMTRVGSTYQLMGWYDGVAPHDVQYNLSFNYA